MRQCPTCSELFDDRVAFCPHDGGQLKKPDPWLGREVDGSVKLVKVAGRGAMGTVYESWQDGMERRVAVKILHGDLSRDSEYIERFYREARAIARLNHPNIVSVFLLGEIDKRPYIVMEFVEGETVLDHIKSETVIDPDRVARIVRQVVSALADAHATNVIHRDLKPSNILLSQRRRAADFVKMLDFGVAKITDATDSQLTQEGYVFGTPAYLSPEQANGVALDHRCDLYSLGVSMFEMLTGDLPFKGNQVKLLLSHARDPAPLVRDINRDVPPELSDLVARLLEKKPDDRPANAEEVADILDRMTASTGISPWASAAWSETSAKAALTNVGVGRVPAATRDATAPRLRVEPQPAGKPPTPRIRPGTADPPWAEGADGDAPWMSRARMTIQQRIRGRGGWLIAVTVLLVALAAGVVLVLGPWSEHVPNHPIEIAVGEMPAVKAPSKPPVILDVPRESVMLGKDGYALRVFRPKEFVAGSTYKITFDVWDPEGEPIEAASIDIELRGPGAPVTHAAKREQRGRFNLAAAFAEAGDHTLSIKVGVEPVVLFFSVKKSG